MTSDLQKAEAFQLPHSDTEVIHKALRQLHDYFLLRKADMPKCIIFPEDSGRPMYWASRPLIAKEYGLKFPHVSFLKEDWDTFNQAQYNAWLTQKKRNDNLTSSNMYFGIQERRRKKLIEKRVNEIVKRSNLDPKDRILVIDDYARSWQTNRKNPPTRERMRTLFKAVGIQHVDFFAFMTDQFKTQVAQHDYLAGALDPDPKARGGWWSEGFGWRKVDDSVKAQLLGVQKSNDGSPYTKRVLPHTNSLHRIMGELGKSFVRTLQD